MTTALSAAGVCWQPVKIGVRCPAAGCDEPVPLPVPVLARPVVEAGSAALELSVPVAAFMAHFELVAYCEECGDAEMTPTHIDRPGGRPYEIHHHRCEQCGRSAAYRRPATEDQ